MVAQGATSFRRDSAAAICRLVGGDVSLIPEIEARHATMDGSATEGFLLADQTTPAHDVEETAMETEVRCSNTSCHICPMTLNMLKSAAYGLNLRQKVHPS